MLELTGSVISHVQPAGTDLSSEKAAIHILNASDQPILAQTTIRLSLSPRARPPEIAEHEELEAARRVGTTEALELFIQRHPDGRYRAEAEAALQRLRAKNSATAR